MSVSPTFIYLCASEHPPRSAGGDQAAAAGGAEEGESQSRSRVKKRQRCSIWLQRGGVTVTQFSVVVEAADVQLARRGCLCPDSATPTNYRCAAPSCRRPEVCEECIR